MERAIRSIARILADELAERIEMPSQLAPNSQPVEIDVAALVKQLSSPESNQALRQFFSMNHRWVALLAERNRRAAESTYDFVDREMPEAMFLLDQFAVIDSRRDEILELDGQILDLGVYKGASTRALARIFPERRIHGFDSFEGLPEDWSHTPRGSFGHIDGQLPSVPANVTLHKGWFDESLPAWTEQHGDYPISLLRIDCDIYSSTHTILNVLSPLIQPGTWLVFDELIGYYGWELHEHKAFGEFLTRHGFSHTYVAYGLTYAIVRLGEPADV